MIVMPRHELQQAGDGKIESRLDAGSPAWIGLLVFRLAAVLATCIVVVGVLRRLKRLAVRSWISSLAHFWFGRAVVASLGSKSSKCISIPLCRHLPGVLKVSTGPGFAASPSPLRSKFICQLPLLAL